ncbi:hypothetical protein GMI69_03890 [Eggerthellaceae bacterium zg-887]|uniref:N-acetylmuramoyl-L-alanine amidase family protein n=1 Tax=Xiamenia xianingshaonis TaxID=2682776 RepID=UPI00140C304E|nr:hypothetical protein [Xiamenia xianingshaonis]NHM15814.1 hypothetical protein [Xiamenia xianingshaonis]
MLTEKDMPELKDPTVGVSYKDDFNTTNAIVRDVELSTGAKVSTLLDITYPTTVGAQSTAITAMVNNKALYTVAGAATATAELKSASSTPAVNNYTFGMNGQNAITSLPVPIDVKANGTYEATFGSAGDGDTISDSDMKTTSTDDYVKGAATKLVPAFEVTSLVTDGSTKKEVAMALPTAAYQAVWKDADGVEVGNAGIILPGVYTPTIMVGGKNGVNLDNDLEFTVIGKLQNADSVKFNGSTVANIASATIKIIKNENDTKADIENQIKNGLEFTFGSGENKVVVPKEDLVVSIANLASGVATVSTTGGKDGIFGGSVEVKYAFGKDLPEATLTNKVDKENKAPYDGANGYELEDLVVINDPDRKGQFIPSTDYTVSTTVKDAQGKPVTITTANDTASSKASISEVGTYELTVTPTGSTYVGPAQKFTVAIEPLEVTAKNSTVAWTGLEGNSKGWYTAFSGKAAEPMPTYTVTFDNSPAQTIIPVGPDGTVLPTTEATIAYANNTAVGDATATVSFSGNYAGTLTTNFKINAADIARAQVNAQSQLADQFNDDGDLNADDVVNPVVTLGNATLELGTDYEITNVYATPKAQAGTLPAGQASYTFAIKGVGNYTGVATGTFMTTDQDITKLWSPALSEDEFLYTGSQITPDKKDSAWEDADIIFNAPQAEGSTAKPTPLAKQPVLGTDYVVTYGENVDAGEGTLTIVGTGGYAGSIEVPFTIEALDITGAKTNEIVVEGAEGLVYTGEAFEPKVDRTKSYVTPTNEGYAGGHKKLSDYVDDIEITYENNTNASTAEAPAYVVIKGTGNVTGEVKVPFEIAPAELTADDVAVAASVAPGADAADAVKVTFGEAELVADEDYTVATEGTLPGAVKATVAGTGNFTGTVEKESAVLYDLGDVTFVVKDATYDGKAKTPAVAEAYYMKGGEKVAVPAEAYTQAAGTYVDAGSYEVPFAGKASAGWTGEATASYTIAKAQGPKAAEVTYTAAGAYKVTVPGLTEGVDFKVTPNPAQGKLAITYMGNYTGSTTVDYVPAAKPVTPAPDQPAAGKTGWVGSGNDWAYYENGVQVKGGWKLIGGEWYHFEANGKMTNTKWFQDADGTWYLLNQDHKGTYGSMLTGWQKVDGGWYYFAKSGAMQSGWVKDGAWYLLNTAHDGTFGKMLTGWQQVGGKWYYMDASGAMAENEWVGRYWVDGSGVWTATR